MYTHKSGNSKLCAVMLNLLGSHADVQGSMISYRDDHIQESNWKLRICERLRLPKDSLWLQESEVARIANRSLNSLKASEGDAAEPDSEAAKLLALLLPPKSFQGMFIQIGSEIFISGWILGLYDVQNR